MKIVLDDGAELKTSLPTVVQEIIKTVESLPDGKAISRRALCGIVGKSIDRLNVYSPHPALRTYKFKHSGKVYFSNAKTAAEGRKQFPQ